MKILLVTSNGELCSRLMAVLQEQGYQTSTNNGFPRSTYLV